MACGHVVPTSHGWLVPIGGLLLLTWHCGEGTILAEYEERQGAEAVEGKMIFRPSTDAKNSKRRGDV